jgi:hypothetical protein
MPIFRRTKALLLHLVCCFAAVNCSVLLYTRRFQFRRKLNVISLAHTRINNLPSSATPCSTCATAARLNRSLPPSKDPVPIVQETGWASGPVWTGAEYLAPSLGFDPRTFQPVASRCTVWDFFSSLQITNLTHNSFSCICLFQFCTCFEQPISYHQESQLYRYDVCYTSLYVGERVVCGVRGTPHSHLQILTYTRGRIDSIDYPDDEHLVARNMYRICKPLI